MRDILLTLLILAAGVGWFSVYGPKELQEPSPPSGYVMPGEGAELVIPGEGTQSVTVARETKENTGTGQEDAPEPARETTPEMAMEDDTMAPFLIGYIAGAVAVLTGVLVSPVAAWLWERIKTNR